LIRQSAYYQQLPELIAACDELDGTPENIPIIFEDNYVSCIEYANTNASSSSPVSSNSSVFSSSDSMTKKNGQNNTVFMRANSLRSSVSSKQGRKGSVSSNEMSVNSANQSLSESSKQLHKKLRKKVINGDVITNDRKKAVQLVSYRKVNDYFNDQVSLTNSSTLASSNTDIENVNSGGSSTSVGSGGNTSLCESQQTSVQSKLSQIRADLSTRVLTPPGSHRNIHLVNSNNNSNSNSNNNSNSNSNNSSLQSILESRPLNKQAASATDLFKKSFNRTYNPENLSSSPLMATKLIKQQSVTTGPSNTEENYENKPSFQSLTNLSSATSDYSSSATNSNESNPNEIYQANASEQELDVEITDSINQIDLSINSDETGSAISDMESVGVNDNGKHTGPNNSNKQGPSDCSFKSRALYESFRGKPSTLERPKTKLRMSLKCTYNDINNPIKKSNAFNDNSKKTINEFLAMEDEEDDLECKLVTVKTEEHFKKIPDPKPRTLKRQLTINTDKNSLSAILNENLFK